MKTFIIIYDYRAKGNFGFQNQMTLQAMDDSSAIDQAKQEICKVYGEKELCRFKFKIKATI